MPISSNVHVLTSTELERIKDEAFQRGVQRGMFEQSFSKRQEVARNCANWKDGRCEVCGVPSQYMEVSADFKCTSFSPTPHPTSGGGE